MKKNIIKKLIFAFICANIIFAQICFGAVHSKMTINNPPEYYKGRKLVYLEKALVIAMDDAKVPYANVTVDNKTFTYEQGTVVYHITFTNENTKYQYFYNIDAMDGRIMSSEERHLNENNQYYVFKKNDYDYSNSIATATNDLGIDKISNNIIALVPNSTLNDLKIHEMYDGGRKYYEGDLYYDSIDYSFKVDAVDGKIVKWERSYTPEVGAVRPEEFDFGDLISNS